MSDTDTIDEDRWNKILCLSLGEDNGTGFKYQALMNYMNNDSLDDNLKIVITNLLVIGIYHPEQRTQMMRGIIQLVKGHPKGIPLISAQFLGKKYQSWEEWQENNMTDEWKVLITDAANIQKEVEIIRHSYNKANTKLQEYRSKLKTSYDEDKSQYVILESEKMVQENLDKDGANL